MTSEKLSAELAKSVDRIWSLREVFFTDTEFCGDAIDELPDKPESEEDVERSQSIARQFLRSFVAEVDGITNALVEEADRLQELGYGSVDSSIRGAIPEWGHVAKRVVPSFKAFAQAFGISYAPSEQTGSKILERTARVRNRITHPDTAAEMHVSDQEIDEFRAAIFWFERELEALLQACGRGGLNMLEPT